MGKWKETTLDEIAFINPPENLKNGIKAKKVTMDMLIPFTKIIPTYSIEEYKGGMKFRNGDTLIARITPCLENGKTAYVDILDDGEIGFGSTEFIVLREKEDRSDKHFLYYFSMSPNFRDVAILSMTGSSGRQRVQTEVVRNHLFLFPPLPEQRAIASVLGSLDDKIDLLNRENQTLEQMAEAIFRQWFIEEADEEWEEGSLLELIELVGGGTPKTSIAEYWDGSIPWLSGKDISSNHKTFVTDTEKMITEDGLNNSSTKILPKYATIISARGTVGKYCLLAQPMAFSQTNYGILPKIEGCFFFTYLLINHLVEELRASAYGCVFDTITTSTFRDSEVPIPSNTEINEFEDSVSPFFQRICQNKMQIRTLEKLRDTLLPKLMSGEVRVRFTDSEVQK
jgi:type I restriction enzyme S subunit